MSNKYSIMNSKIDLNIIGTLLLKGKIPYFILAFVIWLFYFNTISFTFSPIDDPGLIEKRISYLTDYTNILEVFTTPLEMASATYFYRPILELSFMIDAFIGQGKPWSFHASNLIYHIITVFLLFNVLLMIGTNKLYAFVTSMFFAIHPTNISIISWIPARNDSLLAIVLLFSLISYDTYLKLDLKKNYIIILLTFFIALLTKENAVVIPIILISYHILIKRKNLDKLLKPILGWVIVFGLWFLLRTYAFIDISSTLNIREPGEILINTAITSLMYVGKIIYPFHQSIMPNIIDTPILPNIIMTLVLIALYIYAWKTNKSYTLFGLIIIFSIISIPLFWGTVMGMANAFEHRIYIIIIGVIFSLSRIKYSEILSRSFITTAIVLFLLIYSVTSISRSAVYADEQSFTESVVNESPSIWQAHALIADYYAKTPNHHKAIEEYSIAIDMTTDPNPNTLIYSRGTQYQNIRDFTHALEDYSIIILRDPEFSDVYYNKGLIHKELGDYQLAISNISHAISLDSNRHEFYKGRGESYIKTRQYQLAMEEFSKVLLKEPEDILSLNNRCVALFFLKDYKSAYYELTLIESLGGEVNPEFKKAILDKYSILVR